MSLAEAPTISLDLANRAGHLSDPLGAKCAGEQGVYKNVHCKGHGVVYAERKFKVKSASDTKANPVSSWRGGHTAVTHPQTVTCEIYSTAKTCPEPVAKAWDHHDGDVTKKIRTCHMLVSYQPKDNYKSSSIASARMANGGAPVEAKQPWVQHKHFACQPAAVWNKFRNTRAEWVIDYDVTDRAGNRAVTVTFSLVILNTKAPSCPYMAHKTIQAVDRDATQAHFHANYGCDRKLFHIHWHFYKVTSNYDSTARMTSKSTFRYCYPHRGHYHCSAYKTCGNVASGRATCASAGAVIDTRRLGTHKWDMKASDFSGVFGKGAMNNVCKSAWHVHVVDTIAPHVTVNKAYTVCVRGALSRYGRTTWNNANCNGTGKKCNLTKMIGAVTVKSGAACSAACVRQQAYRVVGSKGVPAACTHFVFHAVRGGQHCHLYSGSIAPRAGAGWKKYTFGYPVQEKHVNHWECHFSYPYKEYQGLCTDMRANYADACNVRPTNPTIRRGPLAKTRCTGLGTFKIKYTCSDGKNVASKTRTVTVRDTSPPTLHISTSCDHQVKRYTKYGNGGRHVGYRPSCKKAYNYRLINKGDRGNLLDSHVIQISAGYLKDLPIINNLKTFGTGYSCSDACSRVSELKVYTEWYAMVGAKPVKKAFNNLVPGTYILKYVCKDCAGHTSSKARTIIQEDPVKPVIRILGKDLMTLEATHDSNYVDDGATCSDQVDGMISQNVEVSGDVVNLSRRNKYVISYNCKDSAGNAADTAMRVVYVTQTSCPTCKITGSLKVVREASFPYYDAGAVCTDLIDRVPPKQQRKNPVNVEATGKYTVSYRAMNSIGLWSDGKKCRYGAQVYERTVTVIDTLQPVIRLYYANKHIKTGQTYNYNGDQKDYPTFTAGSQPKLKNRNPADDAAVHVSNFKAKPYVHFMAESAQTSSVNGWVLGAAASAVTGLALLGYSMRKTNVATSVPV